MNKFYVHRIQGKLICTMVAFAGLIIACQNQSTSAKEIDSSQQIKKTQVVLKTQNFDYDSTNLTKVTGPYRSVQKLSIPKDLASQNKWIMFEGPVLENDKVAYRYYADSRHLFDIYGKKVQDLVMDTVSWNYHDIMDWGSDILKVNSSLGIGSPAIYYRDTLYPFSNWDEKIIEVIKNEDQISSLRTTFKGLKISDYSYDIVQDWTLQAGQFWSTIDLHIVDDTLASNMHFASGIVKHLPNITSDTLHGQFYAGTFGKQSYHEQNLGMALMVNTQFMPRYVINDDTHLYVFDDANQACSYQFMAQWAEGVDGIATANEFFNEVKNACQKVN